MTGLLANRRALVAAALTVFVVLLVIEVRVRSGLDSTELSEWDANSFLAHERDDHGRLLSEVVALQATPQPPGGRLILIGGSTIREGLLPDPVVQQELDATTEPAPTVHTLYSFDQSMVETARIALNLPLGAGDTVVISINPRRVGFGEETLDQEFKASRFSLLGADPLEDLVAEPEVEQARPAPTGFSDRVDKIGNSVAFSPWDQAAVFENRLFLRQWIEGRLDGRTTQAWSDLFAGRLTDVSWSSLADVSFRDVRRPVRYGYGNQPLSDLEKASLAAEVADTRVAGYFEHHDLDFAVAAALGATIQQSGARVVFIELPRSSLSVDAYGPVWDDYNAEVDALVTALGATRLDLREVPIDDDDFFDLEHLLAGARPVLTDAVFEALLGTELGFVE